MEILKDFSTLSLPITEPEYRAMPELSYSTLSTFMTLGFTGLDHLFDHKESPSLTLGSAVDAIITGGEEEFNAHFVVFDIPSVGDKERQVADYLFNLYGATYPEVLGIPGTYILEAANNIGFQKNWRDDTRVKVLTERISQYYTAKTHAAGRTILTTAVFTDVQNMVRALKTFPATCGYFADNDPMSSIRRYYQLKFRADLEGVGYRCMADLIILDYEDKKVYPIDLKTSLSCAEWDFEQNFKKWHYFIQARLYGKILRANMDADDYFKDFSLENYRFIIVNPKTLTPLVWEFPFTKSEGDLITDDGEIIKNPLELGKELRSYLDCRPLVPQGIDKDGINIIRCIKELKNENQ